jgi:hypothetical protein
MAESRFDPNPVALAALTAQLDEAMAAAAEAGAEQLRDNLSAGARSGVQYPQLPRRSSSPGEYSQEQSGQLKGMVDHGQHAPASAWFGLAPQNADELGEAKGQEFGNPENSLVGRANVRKTALDSRTHKRMNEAVKKAVK